MLIHINVHVNLLEHVVHQQKFLWNRSNTCPSSWERNLVPLVCKHARCVNNKHENGWFHSGSNNRSVVYLNKHFCAFYVPVYGFVKDRKLSARFEKTGVKMIACIYYDLLRHVKSNVNRSSTMKLNTVYRSQDIGLGLWMMIEFCWKKHEFK